MFRIRKPRTSKKYCEQILHYLLRRPCTTSVEILCAINGKGGVVLNSLGELYDRGIVEVSYSNYCIGALYYINNSWIEYALKCKPGRRK